MDYTIFFQQTTGHAPYPYQTALGEGPWPELLDVPTGLGKTAAVVSAWLWRNLRGDPGTPRRLIYCLPMRVLAEQTLANAQQWIEMSREMFSDRALPTPRAHLLQGGEIDATWTEHPETPAIIVGTQDMLLSRALLRGYGMSRYQWPIHFALLHNDALWVFDEIQLLGPGLGTSAQMEAFRREFGTALPSRSLWMSATLCADWIGTVDLTPHLPAFQKHGLGPADLDHEPVSRRRQAAKRLIRATTQLDADNRKEQTKEYARTLATEVVSAHEPGTTTLVILNTVDRAQTLYRELSKHAIGFDLLLVHGRFRPEDRRLRNQALQTRPPPSGRIVVATQAVEAGVDMTSATLFTELAPWSSMVQRFGRCNRHGELDDAAVYWIDIESDEQGAAPYEPGDLEAARHELERLRRADPGSLAPTNSPPPLHPILRRRDLLELFDTDPDLSGFDLDVSVYIRDTSDTGIQVFWREIDGTDEQPQPTPPELCSVSLGAFRRYLKTKVRGSVRTPLRWDPLDERWVPARGDLRPGLILLLDESLGGYDQAVGFDPKGKAPVPVLLDAEHRNPPTGFGADPRSRRTDFVSLETHLAAAETEARALIRQFSPDATADAVIRAARWHDVGKAHPVFQHTLADCPAAEGRTDAPWAKSPARGRHTRPQFRHELASALAWFTHRHEEPDADLVAYLLAAHHGKVRMGLRPLPTETEPTPPLGPRYARGVWEGDLLPPVSVPGEPPLPETRLELDLMELGMGPAGPSWTSRTLDLLARYGPFRLAWYETLVRVADWRASAQGEEVTE